MKIFIAIIVIITVNSILTYVQASHFRKEYLSLIKEYKDYIISTGKNTRIFKKGSVAVVVADSAGVIRHCRYMRGRTILAKLAVRDDLNGLTVSEAMEIYEDDPAIYQALGFIKEKLENPEGKKEIPEIEEDNIEA